MLRLDHLTVIAPTLAEGVAHVRDCLDLDVPFGTRHDYMGTHNHRLQLGRNVYLEIVALDPEGVPPGRARWFGLDNREQVRADWREGQRLRGWVANTVAMDAVMAAHPGIFGEKIALPPAEPNFDFSIPANGSLPLDGAVPSMIDHRGDSDFIAAIPDLGARLRSFTLEHPDAVAIERIYRSLAIDRPPAVIQAIKPRYRALIETRGGLKELT